MLSLLDVVEGWAAGRTASATGVSVEFSCGPVERRVRSASVGFESADRLGIVSVWESGAVEAEIVVVDTLERPLVVSAESMTAPDLRALLDSVLREMAGPD